ncbi:uncharacterized protein LOC127709457 isoform X3 [Mytilus californianus]|uniref:uncharacterized protein LOC127709457 isoform X3 n=1 Tax=Mytilus californianus TaxID=6549 RepID=UPI00224723D7|nr:uncharacterized protein LOC127709457 isoform X3 [Mytilus californianus]
MPKMKLIISLFFGFIGFQISPQASFKENEGSLGNIEFSCPAGQYFNGGYCFSVVDVPMIWSDADRTCKRQGQYLFWVLDVDEFKAVDHLAKSTWEYYWSGLSRRESWLTANEAIWSKVNKTVPLEEFVWEDDQPDIGYGDCVHIKKDGYGTFGNCLRKLPFVCKAEAVLKGYFLCRSGEGIQSKFVCDGHNDCQDMSDEANCVSRCHYMIDAEHGQGDTKPSGEIVSTNKYQNSRSCFWSIVTNVGSIIKVQIKSFDTEKNADVMELRTGGREGDIFLAELTGIVYNQPLYYSSDNVFNIRLVTDSTVIHAAGFRISWTTDVPEVFNDVQMLTATNSVQHLKSPLYDTGYLPKENVFEWKITASTKNIITMEFKNLDIGKDAKLYLWDQDDISLTPTLEGVSAFKPKHYISKSKSIRLMLISGREGASFPKGIYIKYWEGCKINDMTTEGTIQSPGYFAQSYPENIECTWTIQRPTVETRTMTLRFNKFDIQEEGDYLKIYNDTNNALHTGEGFTGTTDLTNDFEVRSTNGYIKLVFTTNYYLTDSGFEAEFSLDCHNFAVSPETHLNSQSNYKTSFGNIVDFSCDHGHSFVNRGPYENISIKCQKGGEWNAPRIPNCINTYCPIPQRVNNGYIIESSGVKVGNNVTYQCNDGFTMNGEPVIKCLQDGSWEETPRCTAARCSALSTPRNGDIEILTGDGRDFASVVQYVCDPGYETYGNVTTYCQTSGKWSHVPPSCEKIWCPIPRTLNGSMYPSGAQQYEGTITLICDRGFGINGTNMREVVLKCESGGKFLPDVTCYGNAGHQLICPLNKTIYIKTAAGEVFNVSDVVSVTPSDSEFIFSPSELITFDHTTMVEQKKVVVTASDKWGAENQCSFLVETKAVACFRESFPVSVLNATPLFCTSGNISCTVTCNSGFVFYDGNTTKKYACTGRNMWLPALPPDTCIKYDEPSYIIVLQVVYKTDGKFAKDCKSGHDDKIKTNNASFTNDIYNRCNIPNVVSVGPVVITNTETTTTGFDLRTSFTVQLPSTDLNQIGGKPTCGVLLVNQLGRNDFLDYTGIVQCNSGTTTVVRQTSDSSNKVMSSGNQCENGIRKMTTVDSSSKCIPCPPGTYFGSGDACNICPDGRFQSNFGQDECLACPSDNLVPSEDKTTCLAVCPAGFISVDGLPTCTPCPEDYYWVNKTYCQPCPNGWSTLWKNGIPDINSCKDTSCEMIRQPNKSGKDSQWGEDPRQISIEACEQYCLDSHNCKSIHFESRFCFIYNQTTLLDDKDGTVYSTKQCCNTQYNTVHQLICPLNKTIYINSAAGEIFNISEVASVTSSDSELTFAFSPAELITLDHTAMLEQKKIVVTATNKWGAEDQCSFFVETKAVACFRESFPVSVPNATPLFCTSGNISCTVTCNSGFVFFDGNQTKTYDCTEQNMWLPALPPDTCIKYDEPSYIIVLQVVYTTYQNQVFAKDCKSGHDDKIKSNNASLTNEIYNICNNIVVSAGPVVITNTQTITTGFDLRTMFTIKLPSTDPDQISQKTTCGILLVNQMNRTDFLDYTGIAQCSSDTATVVRHTRDNSNKVISSGNQCDNGIKKMTTVDSSSKCIPCPPGTYSIGGNACNVCPDERFQSNFGQTECLVCPSDNPVPSEDKTSCLAVCQAGFFSVDGVPTCVPCPEDHYWVNKTYCEHCPNSRSSAGKNAITDINGCKDTSCAMIRQANKAGRDAQWGEEPRTISNIEACEQYCLVNQNCESIHFESNFCFIYNQTTLLDDKNGAVYSKKQCYNTQWINCKNNIDNCVGMCTGSNVDPNTNRCKYMLNDYQCICKAGYTGKSCYEEIDECLQQYPCKHGGTCTDMVADFQCSCREGWTGKRCETPMEYCAPSPCANEGVCFNLTDEYFCRCQGGTTGGTCNNFPEVCSIINPCTMKGTCQDVGGTAQCNCNDDYAGTSCQLIKDHCADPDTCKNNGKCVTKPIGFECECGDSYSGTTCSIYTDPCSCNPCHATAKCISNKEKYICYCEQGNLLTDNGCKGIDENFDIFMDRYMNGMPAYLRNPIVSHTNNSMTIMFWIRVLASAGENPVLVSLEKIPIGSVYPTFNTNIQQFIAKGQSVLLRNSTDTMDIQYETDVADGKWHFMVFSWEPLGKFKVFIDSIKKTEYDWMSVILNFNEYVSWQVIFGSGDTLGRISKLRIYKTVFNDIDIYKAKDSISHLSSNQLIQGWTNIKLTRSTFKKVPSGAGDDNVCDINFPECLDEDRTRPKIRCPDDQIKLGTERLTAFTGLKNKYIKLEDVKYVNTSVHDDELYTYGSSNEVFIGYDGALNYDICRFKVYVKYADCPRPETDADIGYCLNSKHICGLNCPSGKAISIKHKLKYRCGALGVYNFDHPMKKFILPACGGQQNQTIALSVSLTYKTVPNCVPTFPSNVKTGLEVKLKIDLPNLWPGMIWCGSQCKWNAVCRRNSKYIDVTFTLPQLSANIDRNGKTYKVREAILIFILQENGLNFNNVAGAQLEGDSVTIDVSSSCPNGYMVVRKQCVECGKGTYRNDTTLTCEFCTIGSYQTNVGRAVCESCESSKTTLNVGSDSFTDCIDNCPSGQYYVPSASSCAFCERHYYQHMSGQDFCYPCPHGMITSEKGSNSSDSCYRWNAEEGFVPNTTDSGEISEGIANAGLIIGLSIGLALLLCIVISVVIVYKRLTTDSDYSVPTDKNQNQGQSHEHHYDEMNDRGQQYLNVGSIPHSHSVSNNEYENADDNYATITDILCGNSSSNNDYFELYEKSMESTNI